MVFSNSESSSFRRAVLGIGSFILLVLIWMIVLWFVFPPQWNERSTAEIIAVHVLPPIAIGFCIAIVRALHQAHILKEAELTAKLQQEQEKEQQQKIAKELAHQQFSLPVVGVGLRSALAETAITHPEKLNPMLPARKMKPCIGCEKEADSIVLYLRERLVQALDELDLAIEQKLPFPLWLAVPNWLSQDEARKLLDSVWYEVYADVSTLPASENIRFLRELDLRDWVNQAFSLFDAPEAPPGLLLLGVDSPFYAVHNGLKIQQRMELATASEAAVAILIAHPSALTISNKASVYDIANSYDALTPYWERERLRAMDLTMYCSVLAGRSAIAYLHRPVEISTYNPRLLEEGLQAALINASINSSKPNGETDGAPTFTIGALVHQGEAGFIQNYQSILNQVLFLQGAQYEATKSGMFITDLFGFIGNAGYWVQCAIAALLASNKAQPVLWVKQGSGNIMLLGLLNPTSIIAME